MDNNYLWTNTIELEYLSSLKKEYHSLLDTVAAASSSEDSLTIVDVGANNGMFALECSQRFPQRALIYAMEPFSAPYRCLCANALNRNCAMMQAQGGLAASQIMPVNLAIASGCDSREGTYLPHYSLLSGFHVSDDTQTALEQGCGRSLSYEFIRSREEIPCTRLDEWMMDYRIEKIDLLNVDVNKAEIEVLASLGTQLSHRVKFVLVRAHECTKNAVSQLLMDTGFEFVHVSDPEVPTFCMHSPKGYNNTIDTHKRYNDWNPSLNTYVIWAHR